MDLFPSIDVSLAKKTAAVWTICKRRGFDGDWDDDAARLAFYNQEIVAMLKRMYQVEKAKDANAAVPEDFDFDGVT